MIQEPPQALADTNDTDVREVVRARRFVRIFASVVGSLIVSGAVLGIVADPTVTLGTGIIQKLSAPDAELKPPALLAMSPPPQAVILGSSRVMKFNPSCIRELTGLKAFNFGLANSLVDGWNAAFRFSLAHAPLRRIVIGVDAEGFNPHGEMDTRLTSSKYLNGYLGRAYHLTWTKATRALFGAQTLHLALTAVRFHFFRPPTTPVGMRWDADGFLTYPIFEQMVQDGTLPREKLLEDSRHILTDVIWRGDFTELEPSRVDLFRDMLTTARDHGIEVDAFIPLLQPELRRVGPWAQIAARNSDLDRLLVQLDHERLLHYHRFLNYEDFAGDRNGYFDGLHMMESNTSRMLLSIFGRDRGCGQDLHEAPNNRTSSGN